MDLLHLTCRSRVESGSPQLNNLLVNFGHPHATWHKVAAPSCTGVSKVVIDQISQHIVQFKGATLHMASIKCSKSILNDLTSS